MSLCAKIRHVDKIFSSPDWSCGIRVSKPRLRVFTTSTKSDSWSEASIDEALRRIAISKVKLPVPQPTSRTALLPVSIVRFLQSHTRSGAFHTTDPFRRLLRDQGRDLLRRPAGRLVADWLITRFEAVRLDPVVDG